MRFAAILNDESAQPLLRDEGAMFDAQPNADGYLHVTAFLSRTGVYDYTPADLTSYGLPASLKDAETVKLFRDQADVFDEASLKSFEFKPITRGHSSHQVNARNIKDHGVGMTKAPVIQSGDRTQVGLVIYDADAVQDYKMGIRELSCGYGCSIEWTPGITDAGEPYHGVQKNIRGNHVALTPTGRAGSDVRIIDAKESNDMADKIDQAEELGAAKATIKALTDERDTLKKDLADSTAKLEKTTGELDAEKAAHLADTATDVMTAKVAARVAILDKARSYAPKITDTKEEAGKSVAKTDTEIMSDAILSVHPDAVLDGKSDEYIAGRFEGLPERADKLAGPPLIDSKKGPRLTAVQMSGFMSR